jgi:hypothetical protein
VSNLGLPEILFILLLNHTIRAWPQGLRMIYIGDRLTVEPPVVEFWENANGL